MMSDTRKFCRVEQFHIIREFLKARFLFIVIGEILSDGEMPCNVVDMLMVYPEVVSFRGAQSAFLSEYYQ